MANESDKGPQPAPTQVQAAPPGHPNAGAPQAPPPAPGPRGPGVPPNPAAAPPEDAAAKAAVDAAADAADRDAARRMPPARARSETRVKAEPPPPQTVTVDPTTLAVQIAAVNRAVQAHVAGQLPTPDLDHTEPGGRYKVEGRWVDAWGRDVDPPEGEG